MMPVGEPPYAALRGRRHVRETASMSAERALDTAVRIGALLDADEVDMVLVTGSAARGLADRSSDIDLYVYGARSAEAALSMHDALRASGARLVFGVPTPVGRFEKFRLADRFVDVEQVDSGVLETIAGRVQIGDIERDDIKIVAGLRDAVAVSGAATLAMWNDRLALTDRVAVAEVARLGRDLLPPRAIHDLTWARSDPLSYAARMSAVLLAGVGLLGVVNRPWIAVHEPKWIPWQVERLAIRPDDVVERISDAISHPTERSIDAATVVLEEIVDLVDEHVDGADTRVPRFALELGTRPGDR
jgi:predicted nucleotidyltransferase